jgi:Protein of unknown function (DUF2934)
MATPKKETNVIQMPVPAPTPDEIAQRAYEIFQSRGGEPGHDLDDWLQAESELLRENAVRRPNRSS